MTSAKLPSHVRHLIVGAGFSGLGMAIKLAESGENDFLVIERGSDVGGTWRDNTYPGAACDVPSQLYSFSFAPNPEWSSSFSPQPEIQAYIKGVADDSGVLDRFVFDTSLEDATWDDAAQVWRVRTSAGEVTANFLISAAGGLVEPKLPEIDGIDSFQGEVFHTARWNHDVDLAGKRIAVIGTGASAIQVIPEIRKIAGHVDVYQRTAPWIVPRNDRTYTGAEKFLFKHVPGVQKAYRAAIYSALEARVPGFTRQPKILAPAKAVALLNIRRGIKDPELRKAVTPDFAIGCKRILISNAYYPALDADNVDLVTTGISKITGDAVVTTDGVERPIDVLIVATGFYTTDQPIAHHITGRDGRTMAEVFAAEGMGAYKGGAVRGFPNLFQTTGPNTGLGHSSMVFMIESAVAYINDAIRTATREGLATVEPTAEAQSDWNDKLQQRMQKTVWTTGGCASWYLDADGKNTTLWPQSTISYRQILSSFDRDAYDVQAARPATKKPAPKKPAPKKKVNA
jgi:cation diffusion facilitator CzcD-associated flavoprotein CzcO